MTDVVTRQHFEGALVPALRHVGGVRLILEEQRTRAEVYGIGHRHPVVLRVSMAMATKLVAAGAPVTVHDRRQDRPPGRSTDAPAARSR